MSDGRPPASRISCDIDLSAPGKGAGYLRMPNSVNDSAYGTVLVPIYRIGDGKGPTLLLTGGIHGDEYEGPVALMNWARAVSADAIRGRVIVVPAVNMPAVQAATRLSPLDNLNMNRVFPGHADGSATLVLAHYLTEFLLPLIDYQMDFHSGGKTLDYLPCVSVKETADAERQKRTFAAAMAFGAPYTLLNRDLDERGLFESVLEKRGILHLSSEFGGGGRVDRDHVATIDSGLWRLLAHFEMLTRPPAAEKPDTRLVEIQDADSFIAAPQTGIFECFLRLGESVAAGQVVGRIHFPDDVERAPLPIVSNRDGFVICLRPLGEVRRGDNIVIVARTLNLS